MEKVEKVEEVEGERSRLGVGARMLMMERMTRRERWVVVGIAVVLCEVGRWAYMRFRVEDEGK